MLGGVKIENELTQEEVNVYSTCDEPKIACLVDCLDHSAWLTTEN